MITTTPIPKLDMSGLGLNPKAAPLEHVPRLNVDECVGCNLCAQVCLVEDCITMMRLENGLALEIWEERAKAGLETATLKEG